MKITSLALLSVGNARKVTMVDVQRNIGGPFLESLPGYERSFNYGSFNSLSGKINFLCHYEIFKHALFSVIHSLTKTEWLCYKISRRLNNGKKRN